MKQPFIFYRLPRVQEELGLKHTAIFDRVAKKLLTKSVPLGGRATGWPSHELDAIKKAMLAGATEAQLRELVISLEAKRKSGAPMQAAA